jgi:hypothetical protein
VYLGLEPGTFFLAGLHSSDLEYLPKNPAMHSIP